MKRRLFLAAPGLLAAPLIARAGHADAELLHHYRLWAQAKRDCIALSYLPGNENLDTPEALDADRRQDAAFDAMMATPARTMEGIAVLAALIWDCNGPDTYVNHPEYAVQAAYYENRPTLALWRSATGRDDHPPLIRQR